MKTPSNTELQWKIESLERQVGALTDMMLFMTAHLAHVSPERADELLLQIRGIQQMDATWTPEYVALLDRIRRALDGDGMHLDSLR